MNKTIPLVLTKYLSAERGVEALQNGRLAWVSSQMYSDPYENTVNAALDFDEKSMVEGVIKEMIAVYFAAQEPSPMGSHPIFKAMMRWRREERFQSEEEIEVAMKDVVPNLVTTHFPVVADHFQKWQKYIRSLRVLSLSDTLDELDCWNRFADGHRGVAFRLSCHEGGPLAEAKAVEYSNIPLPFMSLKEQLAVLFGQVRPDDIPTFEERMLRKPKVERHIKEWRAFMSVDESSGDIDSPVVLPELKQDDLKAVYLGALVDEKLATQIKKLIKDQYPKTKLFRTTIKPKEFGLDFDRLEF